MSLCFQTIYINSSVEMIKELLNCCTDSPMTKAISDCYHNEHIGQYSIVNRLVISGQAMVFLAMKEQRLFVLKVYQRSVRNGKVFKGEVDMLSKIECSGILPIVECCTDSTFLTSEHDEEAKCSFICMPYLENGDLLEWIESKGCFNEKEGKFMSLLLIGTFRYLESKNIYHRDVKPENILIDDNFRPSLIDFGLAADGRHASRGFVGSSHCAAPEVVKEKEYTFKSEVYSLGIVFFYIVTGHYPYSLARITDVGYRLLFEKKFKQYWAGFESKYQVFLSDAFKELFLSMTHHDPKKRPSLDDLLDFEWFKEPGALYEQYRQVMRLRQKKSVLAMQ